MDLQVWCIQRAERCMLYVMSLAQPSQLGSIHSAVSIRCIRSHVMHYHQTCLSAAITALLSLSEAGINHWVSAGKQPRYAICICNWCMWWLWFRGWKIVCSTQSTSPGMISPCGPYQVWLATKRVISMRECALTGHVNWLCLGNYIPIAWTT